MSQVLKTLNSLYLVQHISVVNIEIHFRFLLLSLFVRFQGCYLIHVIYYFTGRNHSV